MKFGNCLIFAILLRLALGGRIASRPSEYGWWRHYWWESPCGRWRAEFNPPVKRRRWLPPPVFSGSVAVSLKKSEINENNHIQTDRCAICETLRPS